MISVPDLILTNKQVEKNHTFGLTSNFSYNCSISNRKKSFKSGSLWILAKQLIMDLAHLLFGPKACNMKTKRFSIWESVVKKKKKKLITYFTLPTSIEDSPC